MLNTKANRAAIALRSLSVNWGFTHAAPGNQPDLITLYAVEKCETCNIEIRAANSIGVVATLKDATLAGLTVETSAPEDGGYSELHEAVCCSACANWKCPTPVDCDVCAHH